MQSYNIPINYPTYPILFNPFQANTFSYTPFSSLNNYNQINYMNYSINNNSVENTQNSNSTSRRQSICEYNSDNLIIFDNKNLDKPKLDNIPKINLSENEIKSAYFKPKKYKDISLSKNTNNNKNDNNNENINILEINVKISKDKIIEFKLKKYDDMFQVAEEACKKNGLSEDHVKFFVYTIIKALNSIYGIYNLKLKEEEIKTLMNLKEKCKSD